jgi:hypothetical protein
VDDLFITSKLDANIDYVTSKLQQQYTTITVHDGQKHSYLGMTFDFSVANKCKISMEGFTTDMLKSSGISGTAKYPHTANLFEIDPNSPKLPILKSEYYHSNSAKASYLSKRSRPEILLAVSFLSTRVTCATEQDLKKLEVLLRYLNGTQHLYLTLSSSKSLVVTGSVDASYGVHADFRSHTGGTISLGGGSVDAKSTKQKLNSKSSTEAELIGISDYLSRLIWTRNFLIEQGYSDIGPVILQQDNQSTIALAQKGFSTSDKTRHINLRYFFIKDRVDSGEVFIVYEPTDTMLADMLTKPIVGARFYQLRTLLLGE